MTVKLTKNSSSSNSFNIINWIYCPWAYLLIKFINLFSFIIWRVQEKNDNNEKKKKKKRINKNFHRRAKKTWYFFFFYSFKYLFMLNVYHINCVPSLKELSSLNWRRHNIITIITNNVVEREIKNKKTKKTKLKLNNFLFFFFW